MLRTQQVLPPPNQAHLALPVTAMNPPSHQSSLPLLTAQKQKSPIKIKGKQHELF